MLIEISPTKSKVAANRSCCYLCLVPDIQENSTYADHTCMISVLSAKVVTSSPDWPIHNVYYILYTLPLESPLPNIVVAPKMSDINIAAIYVKSWMSPKTYHTHIIS